MKTSSPLVYFGSDDFSASMLSQLLQHDFFASRLKYVVTKTPQKKGRGKTLSPTSVDEIASSIPNVRVLYANTKKELDAVMADLETPLTGVLVSYGVIVSNFVLNRFEPGIINFHPSLLPAHRGPSPIEGVILAGDKTTGVSVMKLVAAMDAGPVYAQHQLPLNGTETTSELYQRIIDQTSTWFAQQLESILDGKLTPYEQDESRVTYTKIIKKQDGYLHPDTQTADECERQIRAYLQFPKSRAHIDGHDLIITKAHVVRSANETPLVIRCEKDTYLSIDELVAPSGKTMNADAYLRGRR